jgi:23S rRNA pseudouridine2605 synthase
MNSSESGERLQKVLAAAGVGSRRDCEELIREGRVEVDRRVVTELGFRVDPDQHEIRVDGEVVRIARRVYYLVNKPQNVVSTNYDPDGRPRVIDLVPPHDHLFTVGRLDRSSEGLILVTNDGELANRLAHPRYGVPKTYRVEVAGHPKLDELEQLRKGVHLAEGKVQASKVDLKKRLKQSTMVEIVLREGRNREIRRMLARVGHKVLRLKRIALGPLNLGEVKPGGYRKLDRKEVEALRRASQPDAKARGASEKNARGPAKKRPQSKPGSQRKLGKVLTPESGDFIEYREGEEPAAGRTRKPRDRARSTRPRAAGRGAEKPKGRTSAKPKKKRPR